MLAFAMPGHLEMIVIGIICVLLFGNQLPKIARSVGGAIPSFKKGLRDVQKEIEDVESEMKNLDKEV